MSLKKKDAVQGTKTKVVWIGVGHQDVVDKLPHQTIEKANDWP